VNPQDGRSIAANTSGQGGEMKKLESGVLWGALLIILGLLFLLQSLNIISGTWTLLWSVLFGLGGVAFLYVFVNDRSKNWWSIIPGFTLLGLAALLFLELLFPSAGEWGGGLFLGAIGLSFWAIYLTRREFWWAVIPAGVLSTLAVVATLPSFVSGDLSGGLFFIGIGLTFTLVYLLPTTEGRMKWALIPAGILIVMGLLVMAASASLINYFWPLVLVALGVYVLWRNLATRKAE
jgi:hypothetical protein